MTWPPMNADTPLENKQFICVHLRLSAAYFAFFSSLFRATADHFVRPAVESQLPIVVVTVFPGSFDEWPGH